MPASATMPRIMTGPHPKAAGTLGPEMLAWAEAEGLQPRRAPFRWWQRLVAYRALEVDRKGHLVWDAVLVSAPRQVGKSWLERAVCAWRIHQAERFGEPQALMHLAHKLDTAHEVWLPAAVHFAEVGYKVRWRNGGQSITGPSGSRWMVQAGNQGAGVGFTLSMVLVDEAWSIERDVVDAAIGPTMVEAESPQLWMVSTAGDSTSELMAANRALAIAMAEARDPGRMLIMEWSAPPDPDLDEDDPAVWRAATPHWDERRAERVRSWRERSERYAWRQQWLNQWVPTTGRPLVDPVAWRASETYARPEGRPTFAFDVAPDRTAAAIVVCAGAALEVVKAEAGVGWVAPEVRRLAEAYNPAAIVADPSGPAGSVVDDLADLGPVMRTATARQLCVASGELYDAMAARPPALAHVPHPALDGAVTGATRAPRGSSWAFGRSGGGHVLIAAALAAWGDRHPAKVDAPAVF